MVKIAYEAHPISAERKMELRNSGYKIVDEKFKPQEVKPSIPSRDDIAGMGRKSLIEWLEAHGVEKPKGKTADMREKLTQIMYMDAD